MKAFHFPLQRVLDWRALQLRTQEEKLSMLQGKLAEVLHRENALLVAELNAEMHLLGQASVEGSEFRSLAAFQLRLRHERISLLASRRNYENLLAEQRIRLLKARKDCETVENLKEKRKTAWTYLTDRELENTAAESYISKWVRSNAEK
jgi:flagellar biosynthesis chaperone FliJ